METLLLVLAFLVERIFSLPQPAMEAEEVRAVSEVAYVARVVDGDTIVVRLADGREERVRYIGVDTPEAYGEEIECFAEEAKTFNTELVEQQTVTLTPDTKDRDEYNRLLRYVYIDGTLVQEVLLKGGYAKAIAIGEDTRHYRAFKKQEQQAKSARKGLWGDCQ